MTNENARKSIVFDELNATLRRIGIIAKNSNDPVEVFLATQIDPIMRSVIMDVERTLKNPALEATAIEFMKADEQIPEK
jgi:hypothetical protein